MKLVLFDIDGTLLWSDGAGRDAIRRALLGQMGTAGPIDGYRFDGKTDPQIVRDLMLAAGHPDAERPESIEAVCRQYAVLLEEELETGRRQVAVLGGVPELLDALEPRADAVLGLLTGNIAAGAKLKLRAAGMDFDRFQVGAFGSDAAERPALPPIAAARATPLFGDRPAGADVVIIGDTPADVTCGRSIGARALGVATGSYTRAELDAAGAYAVFDDLSRTDAVMEAIFA